MNKILTFHNDCRLNDRCAKYETCPMILVHKILSGKWKAERTRQCLLGIGHPLERQMAVL